MSKGNINDTKYYVIKQATPLSELTYEELYEDTTADWQEKARKLQIRRWRKIKHQLA